MAAPAARFARPQSSCPGQASTGVRGVRSPIFRRDDENLKCSSGWQRIFRFQKGMMVKRPGTGMGQRESHHLRGHAK